MDLLLQGPTAADKNAHLDTVIPAGTIVHGVSIDGGVATVDLSTSFGSGGGSVSMQGRVAQVVYTLTQFPSVTGVNFKLDGVATTVLGGEGVVLDHPQTRADWESFTPIILVESPLPGDAVSSPFHVTGTSNTFEATLQIRLTDATGAKVFEHNGMATSGTGTHGHVRRDGHVHDDEPWRRHIAHVRVLGQGRRRGQRRGDPGATVIEQSGDVGADALVIREANTDAVLRRPRCGRTHVDADHPVPRRAVDGSSEP